MQAVRRRGYRYLGIHDARLDHGNPLRGVQPQYVSQPVERDHDAVGYR